MSIITYPFTTPGNYTPNDPTKTVVSGGVLTTLLQNNPGQTFVQQFTANTGFTFDNTKAQFIAGILSQIDKRPANATFYASYTNSINGSWGNGVLTGTAYNGAAVSVGELDLSGGSAYVSYPGVGNFDSLQTGCIRFPYKPNYSGSPSATRFFLTNEQSPGINNQITMSHTNTGRIYITVRDGAGAAIINNLFFGVWSPTAFTEYEIELNYDFTSGATRLFIDGTPFGSTFTQTGVRSGAVDVFLLGASHNGLFGTDALIGELLVFDAVQHTTNYTPDWSDIYEYVYLASKVEFPVFTYAGVGNLLALSGLATTQTGTPKFVINDLWYNSGWVSSNGTYEQSNTVAEILAQISSFPVANNIYVDLNFTNSNTTQNDIDIFTLSYTGQIYPVDNPGTLLNTSFRTEGLESFTETPGVKTGLDQIKYILKKEGIWYYYNSGWVVSNESYAQSNTASEIATNKATFTTEGVNVFCKVFLHSETGLTTPSLDVLEIGFNFSGNVADTLGRCIVWGYAKDEYGNISTDPVTAKIDVTAARYESDQGNTTINQKIQTTTPDSTGYYEFTENGGLVESESMLDYNLNAVKYIFTIAGVSKRGTVPKDVSSIELNEII